MKSIKKIIVTPAGRKKFLSILSKYLIYYHNLNEFDEWHLWCNTDKEEDINYIYELGKENNFIKVIPFPDKETILKTCYKDGYNSGKLIFAATIPYFIKMDTTDKDAVYLRLDDDIVFIKKDSIKNIFEYRLNNKDNFLVYGNIVNNSIITNIHQQIGALSKNLGEVSFNAFDQLGLYDGQFAISVHHNFFDKYRNNLLDNYNFDPYVLNDYSTISIQVISWLGKDYLEGFNGDVPKDIHEEAYQSSIIPEKLGKTNAVFGNSLFCHYAAEVQRDSIDTTDILNNYNIIADEYLKDY
jgi:hypothetical protein